jgi:hypothetical protein
MAKGEKKKLDVEAYPYPECREQHVWNPYDGAIDEKAKMAFRVQKCGNCPTKRHQVLSMRTADYGQTVRSHYVYPDDYQIKGGVDRSDRGRLRMRNFLEEIGEG